MAGKELQLQQRMPSGTWHTIMKKPIGQGSAAVFSGSIPAATLRAALSVNQAGSGFLGSFSPRLHYHAT